MLGQSTTMNELVKYAHNPDWFAQLKADGHRHLVEITDGQVEVLNRSGKPKVTGVSHAIMGEFEAFDQGHWVFDGEQVNNRLLLFDLPVAGSLINEQTTFEERYRALELLFMEWQPDPSRIVLLPCARTEAEKFAMAKAAQDERREGIMLRHRSGLYQPGGRSAHLLKCKFVKEADCIIYATNIDGHDNVELVLLDPEDVYPQAPNYPEGVRPIGRASAIGKKPTPEAGQVWEVRYLYVVDPQDPRLYQPRLVRMRTDKEYHECLVDQIEDSFTDKELNLEKNRSIM
jgi:ATP-dependent DNA ligase